MYGIALAEIVKGKEIATMTYAEFSYKICLAAQQIDPDKGAEWAELLNTDTAYTLAIAAGFDDVARELIEGGIYWNENVNREDVTDDDIDYMVDVVVDECKAEVSEGMSLDDTVSEAIDMFA